MTITLTQLDPIGGRAAYEVAGDITGTITVEYREREMPHRAAGWQLVANLSPQTAHPAPAPDPIRINRTEYRGSAHLMIETHPSHAGDLYLFGEQVEFGEYEPGTTYRRRLDAATTRKFRALYNAIIETHHTPARLHHAKIALAEADLERLHTERRELVDAKNREIEDTAHKLAALLNTAVDAINA
ncbi:hypothetical protein O4215_20460 [Rhodococcus maanshanensis]|uniref:hypothetical protein n=1 Tax=Rhodococcus maanshanensis TaxID=183556 RepID=UPI0022B373C5|nr:hypothetical protein [Rhodococcus maanshanensis]MCZ4557937.1 hypothetical protein [Rhodococcus maanshanensis]